LECALLEQVPVITAGSQFTIVRCQYQGRFMEAIEFKQEIGDHPGALKVEITRGFVREKDPGPAREGTCDGNPLLFPTR